MSSPAAEPEAPTARATAQARRRLNALIALFLLFQIAMPLRYYLGGRGTDERFSWRMFSSVRMQRCSASVRETIGGDEREVPLGRALHVAWVGMLERYRPAVVDKFLERRCEGEGVTRVRFARRCTNTDGSTTPPIDATRTCASGAQEVSAP
jgi:hypothetical protein